MNLARFGNPFQDTRSGYAGARARSEYSRRTLSRCAFSRIAAAETRSVTRGVGVHFQLAVSRSAGLQNSQGHSAFVRRASAPPLKTNSACRLVLERSIQYKAVPNHSVNRTRYGSRRKPGVRRLRHLRTPGLRRLPPRAGYLER
jgi:hypothetical protein